MIFCKNIMEITLLYYIYHLVFLKQIDIFYKDFSIKIKFQIRCSCSFFFFFKYFFNPSRRYRSIDVTCLPRKTERACAFHSLAFFFFFFFFEVIKMISVFQVVMFCYSYSHVFRVRLVYVFKN